MWIKKFDAVLRRFLFLLFFFFSPLTFVARGVFTDFFLEDEAECGAVPWDHSAMGGLRAEVPHTLLGAVELDSLCPLLASGGQILIQPPRH